MLSVPNITPALSVAFPLRQPPLAPPSVSSSFFCVCTSCCHPFAPFSWQRACAGSLLRCALFAVAIAAPPRCLPGESSTQTSATPPVFGRPGFSNPCVNACEISVGAKVSPMHHCNPCCARWHLKSLDPAGKASLTNHLRRSKAGVFLHEARRDCQARLPLKRGTNSSRAGRRLKSNCCSCHLSLLVK
jgi:hypothetical protein